MVLRELEFKNGDAKSGQNRRASVGSPKFPEGLIVKE